MSPEDAKLIHQALTEQQRSVTFDISVQGSLKSEHDLEGILEINKQKRASGIFCKTANQVCV